jgi:hypothetical protein
MTEESKGPKKIKPEEFISRFRSKEDLYRYLTQQSKDLNLDDSNYSQRFPPNDLCYKYRIHARYPEPSQITPKTKRGQSH